MNNEQRTILNGCLDQLERLDLEVRKFGDLAETTGDLVDDHLNGRSYSRIVFNMARAYEAGLVALGIINESELDLKPHITDPAEIIERCRYLIENAEEFIFDAQFALGQGNAEETRR